jgi:hypothetical protein
VFSGRVEVFCVAFAFAEDAEFERGRGRRREGCCVERRRGVDEWVCMFVLAHTHC